MPIVAGPTTPAPGSFPSEQEHFDAVEAALNVANARPRDYNNTVTEDCNLLAVADRFGGVRRMSSEIGTRSVRITVVAVGRTPDNAREMRRRHDKLRGQRLTIGGRLSTPIEFESAEPVGPDGDLLGTGSWFSAMSRYTYTV